MLSYDVTLLFLAQISSKNFLDNQILLMAIWKRNNIAQWW